MGSLHNDIHTWASRARARGQDAIEIDLETADRIVAALTTTIEAKPAELKIDERLVQTLTEEDAFRQPHEVLHALRNPPSDTRITVWKDGTWKTWPAMDAIYARGDPDWLVEITGSAIAEFAARVGEDQSDLLAALTPTIVAKPQEIKVAASWAAEELDSLNRRGR